MCSWSSTLREHTFRPVPKALQRSRPASFGGQRCGVRANGLPRHSMKPFLILGEPDDLHAHYVHWALEAAGYETRLIYSSRCPTNTTLYLDNVTDGFTSADWKDIQAAWCRRLPKPPVVEKGHGEDEGFILVEERRFTKWLIEMQEDCAAVRWINSPAVAMHAENKFIQLKRARSHGIHVPRTLITA